MFEQTILDTLVVIGLFVLRVGVPVAILYVAARWVGKKLEPQEMQEPHHHTRPGKIIAFTTPTLKTSIQSNAKPNERDAVRRTNAR
jgi:hypothetical protein